MTTLDDLTVKMAEGRINILSTEPIYSWEKGNGSCVGYLVCYEYQYTGYVDPSSPKTVSTGWRKMAYEYYSPEFTLSPMVEALEEVYKVATRAQDIIATPFKER